MTSTFVAIAGVTGSGKSTLARAIQMHEGKNVSILHLDDYYKSRDQIPKQDGVLNWDVPEAFDFEKLLRDLKTLKDGESVIVTTWDEKLNPDYLQTKQKIPVEIFPSSIIILEGFLSLYNSDIRKMFDISIFLSIPVESSVQRRSGKILRDKKYLDDVVIPAQIEYVEPTKKFANYVLNAENTSAEELLQQSLKLLKV